MSQQQCAVHHSAKREGRVVLVNGGEAPLLSERRRGDRGGKGTFSERWRQLGQRTFDLYEMGLQRGRGRGDPLKHAEWIAAAGFLSTFS